MVLCGVDCVGLLCCLVVKLVNLVRLVVCVWYVLCCCVGVVVWLIVVGV